MMKKLTLSKLQKNMDGHIKCLSKRMNEIEELPSFVNENTENIQQTYNLICDLKDEIEQLKMEINALKLIQMITLKEGRIFKN